MPKDGTVKRVPRTVCETHDSSHYHNHIYGVLNRKFIAQLTLRNPCETQGNNSLLLVTILLPTRESSLSFFLFFSFFSLLFPFLFLFSFPFFSSYPTNNNNNNNNNLAQDEEKEKTNTEIPRIPTTRVESMKHLIFDKYSNIETSSLLSIYPSPPFPRKDNKTSGKRWWHLVPFNRRVSFESGPSYFIDRSTIA